MGRHGCRITDTFYSNCFFTALSAKLHDWKNVTVHYVPHKYQLARCCHFYWTRKDEPDTFYDFTHVHEHEWIFWAEGYIRSHTREEHDTRRNFGLLKQARKLAKKYDFKVWQEEYYELEHDLWFIPIRNNTVLCPALRYGEYRIVGKVYDKNRDVYIKIFDCLPSGEIINPQHENIEKWHEFDSRADSELLNEDWGNHSQMWGALHSRAYMRNTILEYAAEDKRPQIETVFGMYGTNSEAEIAAAEAEIERVFTSFKKSEFSRFVDNESLFDELHVKFGLHSGQNVQRIVDSWNAAYKGDDPFQDTYKYFTSSADEAMKSRKQLRNVFLDSAENEKKAQLEKYFDESKFGTMEQAEKQQIIDVLITNYSLVNERYYKEQLLSGGVVVKALQNPLVDCAKALEEIHKHDYREAAIIRGALRE